MLQSVFLNINGYIAQIVACENSISFLCHCNGRRFSSSYNLMARSRNRGQLDIKAMLRRAYVKRAYHSLSKFNHGVNPGLEMRYAGIRQFSVDLNWNDYPARIKLGKQALSFYPKES